MTTTRAKAEASSEDWDVVTALDEIINRKVGASASSSSSRSGSLPAAAATTTLADYQRQREELKRRERALGFEHKLASTASPKEAQVDQILQDLKRDDDKHVYAAAAAAAPDHSRFAGDHFLGTKTLVDGCRVFGLARRLPKGAHLHIHFNACLPPRVLLDVARGMRHMFVTSDVPLVAEGDDDDDYANYRRARLQFSILPLAASTGNLFDAGYRDRSGAMRFQEFLAEFPRHCPQHYRRHPHHHDGEEEDDEGKAALGWLQEKLVFTEDEAHGARQTGRGAWQAFNARTQMLKGLFNYETAFRAYTRAMLADFVADNIQYAEIRPNFMDTNQVWTDDGRGRIGNAGIVEMIIDEYEKFQAAAAAGEEERGGEGGGRFGGLKIIYCCPRSWSNDKVAGALKECLEFKQRWPQWIAGFDLVGEEGCGKPLRAFAPEFLAFRQACRAAGVGEVPLLLHCGETLDNDDDENNLLDALLLGARRVGHGFALARHPYLAERAKRAGVCLEVCPVSNEVLGLTSRVGGHAVYGLLANNVHCTVNTDNGTFFNSTLSHDFYQIMAGKADMTLFGWKQLVLWSLEHACLAEDEYDRIYADWARRWERFLDETIAEFGGEGTL